MLLEFTVENFLSIKEPVTFSLISTKDHSLPDNLFSTEAAKNTGILKSVAIFGANASGKTNILKALSFISNFIRNSHLRQKGDPTGVIPFKLDEVWSKKPSRFEVTFIHNNIKYQYGFTADSRLIYTEYLYYFPNSSRRAVIFERTSPHQYRFTRDKELQETLSSMTLENILYLSRSTQFNYQKTSEAFDWFENQIVIKIEHDDQSWREFTLKKLNESPAYKKLITSILANADTGIIDVNAIVRDTKEDYPQHDRPKKFNIKTYHQILSPDENTKYIEFDLTEESNGTIKLFDLLGYITDTIEHGKTIIIDELDVRLHPLLIRSIVELFHDPEQNKKNAQLLFSTHDSNLLNYNIFRRDQIWFTERKTSNSGTDLYSLSDINPRKDENIRKGYLAGRYGGVPVSLDFNLHFEKDEQNSDKSANFD